MQSKSQYSLCDSFNISNGLSNNYLSQCAIDAKGFLWIGSENGIMRFDGKQFKDFGAESGLEDIEVLSLICDNSGILWINTVNGSIFYFDQIRKRFVEPSDFKSYKPFKQLNSISTGGIQFQSKKGSFFYFNKKLDFFPLSNNSDSTRVFVKHNNIALIRYKLVNNKKTLKLIKIVNNKKVAQTEIELGLTASSLSVNNNCIFLFDSAHNNIIRISNINENDLTYSFSKIETKGQYYHHTFSKSYIVLHRRYSIGKKGIVDLEVYDKEQLNYLFTIGNSFLAHNLEDDNKGNLWVCTSSGLYRYCISKEIRPLLKNEDMQRVYYSGVLNGNRHYFLGNEDDEIINWKKGAYSKHKLRIHQQSEWQRDLVICGNKLFSFTDGGIVLNYNYPILANNSLLATKLAFKHNDSIIYTATDKGLFELNAQTLKLKQIIAIDQIRSITSLSNDSILLASTGGLLSLNLNANNDIKEILHDTFSRYWPNSLCKTADSLYWVGTANNGIFILKNYSIVGHINKINGLSSDLIRTIVKGENGVLWVGSFSGISKINYIETESGLKYKIQNFSRVNGLSSDIINALLYDKNILIAMTDKGVYEIPDSISIPEISIEVTSIKINQNDTTLIDYFELEPNQNRITIEFCGIELNGHFDHAQFSQDKGKTWVDLENNNFRTEWQSGKHSLWLRAVDVNKNISKQITKLQFNIDTYLYKRPWFWLVIALIVLAIAIYINTLYTKRKQQRRIDQLMNQQAMDELEIQSLKAQMNPHFVFNCLNSIKGFIYDEDFEKADEYLDKFASLLRNTLDFSTKPSISLRAELEYIDTYLSLEQLRFTNKFKYDIHIETGIDQDALAIPAMILQPYVENAIKHGVCNLDDGIGEISIKVYIVADKLHIDIDDNGVGRILAEELKTSKSPGHQSKGTQVTQRRTELYHIELSICDKKDEEGNPIGTLVHLEIPIPLY